MITTNTVRNLLSISDRAPFDRLTETELLLVSRHVHRRRFAPDEVIQAEGMIAEKLIIVVEGKVLLGGQPAPDIFDAESALFGLPAQADYVAGPDGVEALCLAKPHLFTIARECPDFIVGLAAAGGSAPQ